MKGEKVIAKINVSITSYMDIYGIEYSGLTADGELLNGMEIRSKMNLAVGNGG